MDYIQLQNLRNTYPVETATDLNNVKSFYSKEEGYVRKYGKDKSNSYIDFKTYPINKINVLDPTLYPYVDFKFIVQFYDEEAGFMEEWTSAPFKKLLLKAQEDGNPYFNKFTVPIIPVDYGELKNHHRINKLSIGELYSEVSVTKTISTIEEMLLHIQWLVVFTDEFRNTEFGKPISDPTYPIDGIGTYKINHNPKGTFGMGWSDYLKQTLNDKEFASAITSDTLKPKEVKVTTPSNKSVEIIQPPKTEPSTPSPIYTQPANYEYSPTYSSGGSRHGGVYYPSDYYGPGYYNDSNNPTIQFRNDYYNIR